MKYDHAKKSEATDKQDAITQPGRIRKPSPQTVGMPQYLLQSKSQLQRQPIEEEEEELQPKFGVDSIQRQPLEEEEETLQTKPFSTAVQAKLSVSRPLRERSRSYC